MGKKGKKVIREQSGQTGEETGNRWAGSGGKNKWRKSDRGTDEHNQWSIQHIWYKYIWRVLIQKNDCGLQNESEISFFYQPAVQTFKLHWYKIEKSSKSSYFSSWKLIIDTWLIDYQRGFPRWSVCGSVPAQSVHWEFTETLSQNKCILMYRRAPSPPLEAATCLYKHHKTTI